MLIVVMLCGYPNTAHFPIIFQIFQKSKIGFCYHKDMSEFVFMHMWVHEWVCVCVCACVWMWMSMWMPEGSLRCYLQDTTYLHQAGSLIGLAFTQLARVAGHGAHRNHLVQPHQTTVTTLFCSCYIRSGDWTQLGSHKTRTFLTDWATPLVSNLSTFHIF